MGTCAAMLLNLLVKTPDPCLAAATRQLNSAWTENGPLDHPESLTDDAIGRWRKAESHLLFHENLRQIDRLERPSVRF